MTARAQLTEVIKRVDMLLMSEEEIRQYTNCASIVKGVRQLLDMGLQYVVVKQGSYGALLFGADGTFFSAPTYPLEEVIDPTGVMHSQAVCLAIFRRSSPSKMAATVLTRSSSVSCMETLLARLCAKTSALAG